MPERPFNPDQPYLLPPSVLDWVPPRHIARFVVSFLQRLSAAQWRAMGIDPVPAVKGEARYAPMALMGISLLGVLYAIPSSRKLERACQESIPFRVVSGNQCPDHNTLHRFLRAHREACGSMLQLSVDLANELGIVGWEFQAVDGTKIQANATSGKAMTRAQLAEVRHLSDARIAAILQRDDTDPPEPSDLPELPDDLTDPAVLDHLIQQRLQDRELTGRSVLSPDDDGDIAPDLPNPGLGADAGRELQQARRRRRRIITAQTHLEQREREKWDRRTVTKVNLTDPDAIPIKTRFGIHSRYNAQLVVSPMPEGGRIIVAATVVTEGNDLHQLVPMLDQATATTGRQAELTVADAGYHTGAALQGCHERGARVVVTLHDWSKPKGAIGTDAFIHDPERNVLRCPEGQALSFRHLEAHRHQPVAVYRAPVAVCRACPRYAECVPTQDGGRKVRRSIYQVVMQQHRDWMQTAPAQVAARRRKGVIEGVIGTLKTQFGAGRAKGRGLQSVCAEWHLAAAAYNLKTLHKAWTGGYGPVLHQRVATLLG